jgi:ribosomal protein L12E/L44/L45/RPP1/RPP2
MKNENENIGPSNEELLVSSMILNATKNEITSEQLKTLMTELEYENFSLAILSQTINMEQIQEVIRQTMERKKE